MSIYRCDPNTGDDTNNGITAPVRNLRRLTYLLHQRGPGGHEARLMGGAVHAGFLDIIGSDPANPLRVTSTDPSKPYTIQAPAWGAIVVHGHGGLTVSHGHLIGDGGSSSSGIEFANGHYVSGPAREITLEHMEVEGFGMAGISISAFDTIESVLVANCNLHGNANGLFLSGASADATNRLRRVAVRDTVASDNTLFNAATCGNGMSLVGVDWLEVIGCEVYRNGRGDGQGHSGITVQQCWNGRVAFCHAGLTAPGPENDGQDFVANSSEEIVIEHNESLNSHIGIAVHDDRQYFPGYHARRVVVRNNVIRGAVVGLQVFRTRGDVWLVDNDVAIHSQAGEYRKCIDTYGPHDGPVHILRNTLVADSAAGGTALMLEAAGPGGLRNVEFGERNLWLGNYPVWTVGDSYYGSLAEALSAVPVELPAT